MWAVGDGEKVDRDDLANPHRDRNSVWDGRRARIFGARNEVVAFQVIVQSGPAGIRSLSADLPELRNGRSVIDTLEPATDPTLYAGRNIQVFGENYLDVTRKTNADWIYQQGSASEPPDPLGPTPVQLVPSNARQDRSVPPDSNQGLWFEVYIPRSARAGTYHGTVTVRADGEVRRLPVDLRVFGFTLPDRNSLTAMVYYEPEQVRLYQGRDLDPAYHRFAHRNRVEFVHGYDIASATAALGRFRGTDFTRANGYDGPGAGVGDTLVPRTFYGPEPDFDTPEKAAANARPWTDWLGHNVPRAKTFVYLPDEPDPAQFEYVRSLGEAIHSTGAPLPALVTHRYDASLDGPGRAIDQWAVVGNQYDSARATALRAEGRDMLFYNGQRPNLGSMLVDSPATDPRATVWAAYKMGVRTYFYWHSDHWRHNGQAAPDRPRNQNVWRDPITYFNRHGEYANGDGVLMYPGEEVLHPEENRGIAGPIGTVQLANLRRGLQDHLYLSMARQLGLADEVTSAVRRIVPKVLDETTTDQPVSYPQDGDAYERVRLDLAKAIDRATVRR